MDRHQRAAALHALGVEFGLVFGDPVIFENADKAAHRDTGGHAAERSHQRAGRDQESESRQQHREQARRQPDGASDEGVLHSFRFASFLLQRGSDLRRIVSASVAGYKTNLILSEAGLQKGLPRTFAFAYRSKKSCNCFRHTEH